MLSSVFTTPLLVFPSNVFLFCFMFSRHFQVGRRRLRNTVLSYLHEPRDAAAAKLCLEQFKSADCMTDKLAAVGCLADFDDAGGAFPERYAYM